jgi:hypothetical protein
MTEKLVMDSLGIQTSTVIGCDSKFAAQRFCIDNVPGITHLFGCLDDMIDMAGNCVIHGQSCSMPSHEVDMAVFGPPCQPFSNQRQKSGSSSRTGGVERHPSFYITMVRVVDYIRKHRPKVFIMEEVDAFGDLNDEGRVPLNDFVLSISRFFAAVRVVNLDLASWVQVSRPRIYLVGFTDAVGGVAAADRWITRVQDRRRLCAPHLCSGTLFLVRIGQECSCSCLR